MSCKVPNASVSLLFIPFLCYMFKGKIIHLVTTKVNDIYQGNKDLLKCRDSYQGLTC